MSLLRTRVPRLIGVAVALTVSAALAACSSDSGSTSGAGGSESSEKVVASATENLTEYFDNSAEPLEIAPVADPKILEGKKLMYLSAGISSPGGSAGLQAFDEVKDSLGFELVIYDGEFTLSNYQEGLRQAVAQKVDAVLMYGIDCAGNESALREVRDAGIPVIAMYSADCDELDPDAESLFAAQVQYPIDGEAARILAVSEAYGKAQADYLISSLSGDVKVVQFDVPDFASIASVGDGFRERLKECATCELLDTVVVRVADFGPGLQQMAEQALLKHPDANAISIGYDDLVTLGISAAATSVGLQDDLLVVAGGGLESSVDLIRTDNGLNAGWVLGYAWDNYAGVDATMRYLAGEEPAISGSPVIMYDKDHNLPDSGGLEPTTDFRSAFKTAWGIE